MTDDVLVYDDDCGFCTWWAEFFAARAAVRVVGFSELEGDLRARLPEGYEDCSHLVTDDAVYSCGASLEAALARTALAPAARPLLGRLRSLGAYRALREWGYRRAADNRDVLGRLLSKTPPARESEDGRDDHSGR